MSLSFYVCVFGWGRIVSPSPWLMSISYRKYEDTASF
nr:MAG TPA: hypothetical protein [Caudoviricetes sp.]